MSTTRQDSPEHDPESGAAGALPGDPKLDDELRQRFAAERAHDLTRAPSFARFLVPRRPVGRRRLLQPAFALGVVAILVVAAGVWRRVREGDTRNSIVLVPGQMRVPTDFLLDLASNTMTRADEMPSIGAIDWYPLVTQSELAPNTTRRRN
jgi:hypothetical protein